MYVEIWYASEQTDRGPIKQNNSGPRSVCQIGNQPISYYNRHMKTNSMDLIELTEPGAPPARPERADAVENRARLLAVAEGLFAEFGVEAVSMAEIARAAGVGKGTLYRHFASKGELCMTLLDTQMRAFQERVLTHLRTMTSADAPKLAQLAWFIEALIRFQEHHIPLLTCAGRDVAQRFHPETSPFAWQRMTVHGLLRTALAAGEIHHAIDLDFITDSFLVWVRPDILHRQRTVNGYTTARIITGLQHNLYALVGCGSFTEQPKNDQETLPDG